MIQGLKFVFLNVLLLMSFGNILKAQTGDLLLSHHSLDVEGLDNMNFEILVDSNGLLCLANRSGVLLYDGVRWDFMETPSAALSMAIDSAQNIYVGCVGDYGRIGLLNNQYQFISMKQETTAQGLFFETQIVGDQVYFMSEEQLIRSKIGEEAFLLTLDDKSEYFSNIINLGDQFVFQSSDGVYRDDGQRLESIEFLLPDSAQISFSRKHPGDDKYLIGTADNRLLIYEGGTFDELSASQFISENDIYVNDGAWIDGESYAISTIENGCLIFGLAEDEPSEVIDYHKGLPDNEIFAIATDGENGLWLAHEFGLTRVENNLPVKSYSNYPGLDGNLTGVTTFNDELYVSSSHGVFYLDEEYEYKNSVYYTLKKSSRTSRQKKVKSTKPSTKSNPKKERKTLLRTTNKRGKEKKKPILNGFFNKKKNKNVQLKPANEKTDKEPAKQGLLKRVSLKLSTSKLKDGLIRTLKGKSTETKQYVKRVKREIVNTRYLYKEIEGLAAKTKQFIAFKDKLLVAGNSGVYEINKKTATLIIAEPVRYAYADKESERLIVATYSGAVQIYELLRDLWVEVETLNFPGDIITSIHTDSEGYTWFASPNKLYRVDSFEGENDSIPQMEISNQFIDNVKLTTLGGQLYIINSLGYYYLEEKSGKVIADEQLLKEVGKPLKHLMQEDGSVWIYNGKSWKHILPDKSVASHDALGLFPDMSFVNEMNGKIWLVNESKELFQYNPEVQDSLVSRNKMFFKDIRNQKGQIDRRGDLTFEYNSNSFEFELSRPDYLGLLKVEYQYKLSGLNDAWSSWSRNNKLDFNYLPPNKYVLLVRSRDSFGNIQESNPFQFKINPPYWQTLWFYALQILFMVAMVLISIQLNKRAKTKYVLLTEGLTILTIVLVIEFLQTVAQSYLGLQSSPVVDFMIDVAVALCVFPIEQYLKRIMKADQVGPGLSGKGLFDLLPIKKK